MTEPVWQQLSLISQGHALAPLEDALLDAGALAVTLTDEGDQPVLEPAPGETPTWSQTRVTGLFAADTDMQGVTQRLAAQLDPDVLLSLELHTLEERDWVRAWLDDFKPMRFGERLWVCPSDSSPPEPQAVNLRLDPGLAFGTGTHPTTALCLTWLDGAAVHEQRVLDYGCGSGILAIAAALLGAQQVQVVDIDPQALLACADNARNNGVSAQIMAVDPSTLADGSVDILLANILAGPLVDLAPRFIHALAPQGYLVLSGILSAQVARVQAAYSSHIHFQPYQQREDWVLLVGRKTCAL